MLVDLRTFDAELTGKVAQEVLDRSGITCNRNAIPDDPRPPFVASGLRLGSAAETTAGLGEAEMAEVASLIARALRGREDDDELASRSTAPSGSCAVVSTPIREVSRRPGEGRTGAARRRERDEGRWQAGCRFAELGAAMPGLATGVSRKPSPSFTTLIGMGVTTALCIAAGVGGGYWLDRTFHTGVLLTFVGLALGVVAAVAAVYFEIKTFL